MSDAAFRPRWHACSLLLAALGAVLAVLPSRSVSSESAAPEAKSEVYQAWPFDAAEAKRRQEETAKRLGIPVERAQDLGDGVKLDLVLIPAGRFIMGTPAPEPVDEEGYRSKMLTGEATLGIGGGAFLVLLAVVLVRAIRKRQRPQYSLAWFLVMAVTAGIGLLGGLHWHFSARALADAQREYEAALSRLSDGEGFAKPAQEVTLSRPYYIGKFEVTRGQYLQVTGTKYSDYFKERDFPEMPVSWEDAQAFCEESGKKTGETVRLPSEAEWEYACRAGTRTRFYSGDTDADLESVAWYSANGDRYPFSGGGPHPVGGKAPNAWSLYDMHGNAPEWCADWLAPYEADSVVDPQGPPQEDSLPDRVVRGGAFCSGPRSCPSACRWYSFEWRSSITGFRVVVEVPRTP